MHHKFLYIQIIALYCLLLPLSTHAQKEIANNINTDTIIGIQDSIDENDIVVPENLWSSNIDSLLNSWTFKQKVVLNDNCTSSDENPYFTEDEYIKRLASLPTIIEMPYNQIVRQHIDFYTNRRRELVQYMLGMGEFYFPIFEQELEENNMPIELKYLPIIESALNPNAVSRAGATGLWQFMLTTGRLYGLTNNSLIDERRDPIKSTKAAVKYLKDLHDIFQDWNLTIAAYNCGPGNINKAIKRAGGKTDYWEIYYYLPKETRSYVPSFIAANYVMNYYWAHNICPVIADLSLSSDTVVIKNRLQLQQIADVLEIPLDELRSLNPQYKKDVIPGGDFTEYILRLPMTCAHNFVLMQDSINKYPSSNLLARRLTVEPTDLEKNAGSIEGSTNKTYHKVRSGETLSRIAKKHGVTVKQLKAWNKLRSNNIQIGQKLVIQKG